MASQFRTFQTVQKYEDALARHGQWMRWTQGITCPCIKATTMNADPECPLCNGRGRFYTEPDSFSILDEIVKHDALGRMWPSHTPVVAGSPVAYRNGVQLSLDGTQPSDGSYVQLEAPFPRAYEVIVLNYDFTPDIEVTDEDSTVYGTTTLKTVATSFETRGKSFEGSVKSVSRVYNSTKAETYTVVDAVKEYIYLVDMGTWESGDVLEVDYIYVEPFNFLIVGTTPRIRYEQPYVLDEADSVLITPYWAKVAPNDLLTALASEQIGQVIVNPNVNAGNDQITAFYDLSILMRVLDTTGTFYTVGPGKNVEIYGRNELKWNITKPTVNYSVQFTYHPTYGALRNLHTLRNAENKAFVNRVGVTQFDKVHEEAVF